MKYIAFLAALSAALLSVPSRAALIEEFLFNEPVGTPLTDTINSVAGGHPWIGDPQGDLDGTSTNGSGQYSLAGKNNIELGTGHINNDPDITAGTVYGVMELTWAFDEGSYDSAEPEDIRLSIINLNTASSSSVTAEFIITRPTADSVTLRGNAIGTGSSTISAVPLSLTQSSKFIGVVGANLDSNIYSVYYSQDGGTTFATLSGGTIDATRIGAQLRMYLNNDFSQDNVLIDRVALYTTNPFPGQIAGIPEPSTISLVLLCLVGFAGPRRQR